MGTETALIFGSIPCPSWDFLEPLRGQVTVICADGGTLCAQAAGFRAEVYVGDSDSGGVPPAGARQVLLPAEKDLTDLQAAYQCARDGGFRRMVFTACTGGRQDHHLANLQLLETALEEGIDAAVWDPWNEIRCLPDGEIVVPPGQFRYFSLIPLDRRLEGVTIRDAKYGLENAVVRRGDSLTVSNETVGRPARISVARGRALLVRSERLAP